VAVDRTDHAVTYGGTSWARPVTIDANGGGLTSVSCPTATFCVAVGLKGSAFIYSAGTWSPRDNVDPGGPLEAVSCPSQTSCVAVDPTSMFRWLAATGAVRSATAPTTPAALSVTVSLGSGRQRDGAG